MHWHVGVRHHVRRHSIWKAVRGVAHMRVASHRVLPVQILHRLLVRMLTRWNIHRHCMGLASQHLGRWRRVHAIRWQTVWRHAVWWRMVLHLLLWHAWWTAAAHGQLALLPMLRLVRVLIWVHLLLRHWADAVERRGVWNDLRYALLPEDADP